MGKIIDITGQKFGKLLVLRYDPDTHINNKAYWICQCDCGVIKSIRGQDLRQHKTISCGCYNLQKSKNQWEDLTNQRFGKLIALQHVGSNKAHHALWKCQCDCGRIATVDAYSLKSGNTQSCGCILSNGENIIKSLLEQHHVNFTSQYIDAELVSPKGYPLRFDFRILNNEQQTIGFIEFQGEQHFIPRQDDSKEKFAYRQICDTIKKAYCQRKKLPLIEIPYTDRMNINWNYLENLFNQYSLIGYAASKEGIHDWS